MSGVVKDVSGAAMEGVRIEEEYANNFVLSDETGSFSISVPYDVNYLLISGDLLVSVRVDITDEPLEIIMRLDLDALMERANMTEEDMLAEQAAYEAEEARKVEEEARLAAKSDSTMRARADSIRLAAVRIQRERKDSVEAAKKAVRLEKIRVYDSKFMNHGIIATVDFSYPFQQQASGEVVYENYGFREYGNLTPVQFDASLGYRFSGSFSLSAGTGILMNLTDLSAYGDNFAPKLYGSNVKYSNYDVPVYLNARLYLGRSGVQPIVSVSGGLYLISKCTYANAGVGLSIRTGYSGNLYIMGTAGFTPWPSFNAHTELRYIDAMTFGIKVGLML